MFACCPMRRKYLFICRATTNELIKLKLFGICDVHNMETACKWCVYVPNHICIIASVKKHNCWTPSMVSDPSSNCLCQSIPLHFLAAFVPYALCMFHVHSFLFALKVNSLLPIQMTRYTRVSATDLT